MLETKERFHMEPGKLAGVIHSVQEMHPDASDEDVRVVLLDDLAQEEHQEWLDEAPEEEITDWVRQHLETTQP